MTVFTVGVDFSAVRSKYHKTVTGFGFLTPKYVYVEVFKPIGRYLKNGNFRRGGSISRFSGQNIKKRTPDSNSWPQIAYMGTFLDRSGDF